MSSWRLPSETVTVDIHCVTKWSKLDTVWKGVSLDTLLDGVETSAEYVLAFCDGGYTTNLPLEDRHRRQGVGRLRVRRRAARAGARRPGQAARPAPLLLEEREVGARPRAARRRRCPASGSTTATTTTATRGKSSATAATDLAARDRGRARRRDAPDEKHRARAPVLVGAPRGPARRRPPDRGGRLPGAAELLDRLGAGGRGRS